MIQAVNISRNQGHVLYTIPPGVRRSAAAVRAISILRTLRGLGDLGPYDVAGLIARDTQAYVNGVGYNVEQGIAVSPETFKANLVGDANGMCAGSSWGQTGSRCTVSQADIDAAVAAYAAALAQKVNTFAANVAAGQVVVPQGNYYQSNSGVAAPTGGGSSTAYATPSVAPAPTYPSTVQTQTPTGGGSASTVANTPAQAVVRNLSRPNMPLQVGDMFSLDVMGTPGGLVKITATKNGTPAGTTAWGNADSNGHRSITGTMTAAEVGSWVEAIQVGDGGQPYTLSFNVSPAAANAAGQQSTGAGPTGGGSTTATNVSDTGVTNNATPPPAATSTDGFSIGGVQISTPVLLGLAAAALFFFSGGRR